MSDVLTRLLEGRFPNADGPGMLVAPPIRIVVADSLAGAEASLIDGLHFGRSLGVVSDTRTHAVLASRVASALMGTYEVREVVLPGMPHPDEDTVAAVLSNTAGCDALVAVGSGTINDVTKYAAFQAGKPFAVFGTAPSMNGYTSITAAITIRGHKKSLSARVPAGVFLDLSVLATAPARLIRAGFGDSVCRATAQVDGLLAHRLRGDPYRRAPFDLLAEDEPALIANPAALLSGDRDAMATLARTLVLSGLGMTICGNSRPASQAEHLLSHYFEMMAPAGFVHPLHGEQIAVTTRAVARLQDRILSGPAPVLRPTAIGRADVLAHFGEETGPACWIEFAPKRLDEDAASRASAHVEAIWPDLVAELTGIGRPAAQIADALDAIEAPATPRSIGVDAGLARDAMLRARELRDRWTVLDLAGDAGLLEAEATAWSR